MASNGRCKFEVADLRALPYPDRSFDAVVCLRLLPHSVDWTGLIGELCRVASRSVIVDYPSLRSVNIVACEIFQGQKENRAEYPAIHHLLAPGNPCCLRG